MVDMKRIKEALIKDEMIIGLLSRLEMECRKTLPDVNPSRAHLSVMVICEDESNSQMRIEQLQLGEYTDSTYGKILIDTIVGAADMGLRAHAFIVDNFVTLLDETEAYYVMRGFTIDGRAFGISLKFEKENDVITHVGKCIFLPITPTCDDDPIFREARRGYMSTMFAKIRGDHQGVLH